MSLSVTSTYTSAVDSSVASASVAGQGQVAAFAQSLASAVASVQQQVSQVQAQWQQQQASQLDASGLGNTVSGLTTLLGQFSQALQQLSWGVQFASTPAVTERVAPQSITAVANDAALQQSQAQANQSQASNTELWVRAALNQAIAQAKVNGRDPEVLDGVNTLRGYFSGDAQARSTAIHSIPTSLLSAGGAYETNDFGVQAVAGKPPEGLDTSMPTFKTAWDKDWNRPSLYDMVNSTMGWSGAANAINFADPANRDAALSRKLSDAEVQLFQAGTLTPELQALVAQYRTAVVSS